MHTDYTTYYLTEDAKARLERVAQLIEAEPLRVNMDSWNLNITVVPVEKRPACNTVACVAGWVLADELIQRRIAAGCSQFDDDGLNLQQEFNINDSWDIPVIAARILELPADNSSYVVSTLFAVDRWPDQFLSQATYHSAPNIKKSPWELRGNPLPQTAEYAAVVAERIRYFIKTGK